MLQTRALSWLWPAAYLVSSIEATRHSSHSEVDLWKGDDLAFYVTRPDIRPPLWNITKHVPEEIAPGYWFVSPYADFVGPPDRTEYAPCQAGPLIYDGDGNLVWAGACLSHNRNTFDFRPFQANGSTHLSYVLGRAPEGDVEGAKGMGVVMNGSYYETTRLQALEESQEFNLHEFHLVEDGAKILLISSVSERRNIYKMAVPPHNLHDTRGYFTHDSIVEMDTRNQSIDYQWFPWFNGVSYNESYDVHPPDPGSDGFWDFFHANSIDKDSNGDYIVSARHCSTIYKVFRANNTIAWRLGGKMSDFHQDFNFSSQHDARIVFENSTTLVLTLMDNASDDAGRQNDTALASSAKMVALDLTAENRTARLIKQWDRPDGRLTHKRGNVQMMANDNAFVSWSAQGYMSEHSQNGTLLMEAKFSTPRFDTYRAYKAPFVGTPMEPPVLKAFSFASDAEENAHRMVLSYVSWNGATEVAKWKFYGSSSKTEVESEAIFVGLGEADKRGFETMFTSYGHWSRVFVEAIDAEGHVLVKSEVAMPVMADNITAADTFVNTILSFEQTGTKSNVDSEEVPDSLTKLNADKGLWVSVAIFAIIFTLFTQAVLVGAYSIWRKNRRSPFVRKFSYGKGGFAYSDDTESVESQPMLELERGRSGHEDGMGVYGKPQFSTGSEDSVADSMLGKRDEEKDRR